MKFLHISLILLISCISINKAYSQELPVTNNDYVKLNKMFGVDHKKAGEYFQPVLGKSINRVQGNVEYTPLFELANAFSFYSNNQHPYIYDLSSGKLVLIARGQNSGTETVDNLNNLFIRTSDDWGITWSDPVLVYDHQEDDYDFARYPSVYALNVDGSLVFMYSSPTTNGDGWTGVIDGFYGEDLGTFNSHTGDFTFNGTIYSWGTESNIFGEINDVDIMSLVASRPFPIEGEATSFNTSLLGFRKTNDFISFEGFFPEALHPDKFYNSLPNTRGSTTLKFKAAPNGDLVYSYLGDFVGYNWERFTIAFIKSSDKGETWTEPEIMPFTLVRDFAFDIDPTTQLDSTFIGSCYNMSVADDGTITWICVIQESNEMKTAEEILVRLTEVTYKDGNWTLTSIHEIDDPSLYYYQMTGADPANQTFREIRLAESEDGTKFFLKWIAMVEQDAPDGTPTRTHDVFMTAKNKGGEWGPVINVTDDFRLNRLVWIPEYVPNDLENIPFIELISKVDPGWDDNTKRQAEFVVDIQQEVVRYFVSYNTDDAEPIANETFEINSIFPNPASTTMNIQFSMDNPSQVDVELHNILGQKVALIESGYMTSGTHSVQFDVSNTPSGTYNVSILKNGKRINKLVNIIR